MDRVSPTITETLSDQTPKRQFSHGDELALILQNTNSDLYLFQERHLLFSYKREVYLFPRLYRLQY